MGTTVQVEGELIEEHTEGSLLNVQLHLQH